MGEMGKATCMICGGEFNKSEMEETFTGRPQYRCMKCIALGNKIVNARIRDSFTSGFAKKMKEQRWK